MFNVFQLAKIFGPLVKVTPSKPKPQPSVKPRLEVLEERWCPANYTDTLIWNPVGSSQDASQRANWYDETAKVQGIMAPSAVSPVVLDGSIASKPIEFAAPTQIKSLTVQNGYNSTLFSDNGALITTSANDTVNNGCILTLVSKGGESGFVLASDTNFTVMAGGTLNLTDAVGAIQGVTFFSPQDNNGSAYLNNAGTVTWTGTKVNPGTDPIQDIINIPILNTGTFTADGGTGGASVEPGRLQINGRNNDTLVASFAMTAGTFNLKGGAYVLCENGYYQKGGSLISDSSAGSYPCTLVGSSTEGAGDIQIDGGKVIVDNVTNTVGTLKFSANSVEINGEIDLDGLTTGGNSTSADLLDLTQVTQVTLEANSFLNIGTTGTGQLGTGNQWTVMSYKINALQGFWGTTAVPIGLSLSTGSQKVLVSN